MDSQNLLFLNQQRTIVCWLWVVELFCSNVELFCSYVWRHNDQHLTCFVWNAQLNVLQSFFRIFYTFTLFLFAKISLHKVLIRLVSWTIIVTHSAVALSQNLFFLLFFQHQEPIWFISLTCKWRCWTSTLFLDINFCLKKYT